MEPLVTVRRVLVLVPQVLQLYYAQEQKTQPWKQFELQVLPLRVLLVLLVLQPCYPQQQKSQPLRQMKARVLPPLVLVLRVP